MNKTECESAACVFVIRPPRALRAPAAFARHRAPHRGLRPGAFLENADLASGPACLVLDLELPDLSGLELQRELNMCLPIVFVTGTATSAAPSTR